MSNLVFDYACPKQHISEWRKKMGRNKQKLQQIVVNLTVGVYSIGSSWLIQMN